MNTNYDALYSQGINLMKSGKYEEAVKVLERARTVLLSSRGN